MERRFLSLADVVETLSISMAQGYALVRSGDLPAIQVGPKKVWRIEAKELEAYIERMYAKSRERLKDPENQDS
ncbi:helix-turn-helix domain-containing protein [Antribacter sp. KLBMP9083]|uniref:Helix-turn-helix domain-containing protein n=1 Tax=Antribacter soli TaxID=2910976 RepID=A0AA41QHU0_9MICO|nr:helix-turn-helix domain-containing protein [Antribacter soli]MCF4122394.1 helix-turn-helix domain-containing protein [Antribacter soli]